MIKPSIGLVKGLRKKKQSCSKIALLIKMVGKTGFEPATPWSQTKCSTKLSHFPVYNKLKMVRSKGFEPLTFWFVAKHSIQLSYERMPEVLNNKKNLVAPAGIEPATQGFSVPCSTD